MLSGASFGMGTEWVSNRNGRCAVLVLNQISWTGESVESCWKDGGKNKTQEKAEILKRGKSVPQLALWRRAVVPNFPFLFLDGGMMEGGGIKSRPK